MSKRRFTMPPFARPHYHHYRDENNILIYTTCQIIDANDTVLASGKATVSRRDNPCKKIGRDIARGRALKNYHKQKARVRGNLTGLGGPLPPRTMSSDNTRIIPDGRGPTQRFAKTQP